VSLLSYSVTNQSTRETTFLALKGIDNKLLYSYHYVERNNNIFGVPGYVFTEVGKQEKRRKRMMPRQLKVNACLTFVLATLFYLFFQIAKHQTALAPVNAFADDPYDSVGTAGVQLAMFTTILSLVRAFRPYQLKKDTGNQTVLLIRGKYITCLSVAVTLVADIVAMIRYPSVWIGFPAGQMLIALIGGLALLTALVSWLVFRSAQALMSSPMQGGWRRAITLSCMGILILALYPASWHHNVLGELLTVFVGMALFFASVWAWGMILSPSLETHGEDFIDDLAALYGWFKIHVGRFSALLIPVEKILGSSLLSPVLNRLNPRKNRWYGIALVGMLIGAALAFGEAGLHTGIGSIEVFAGIECLGVLSGYAFFVKPLELARHDSDTE